MTEERTPFQSIAAGTRFALSTPLGRVLTILGAAGFIFGLVLSLFPVSAGSGVSCGTVFSPTSDTFGPAAECGQRLAVHAVRVGTLVLGGAAMVALVFAGIGLARAFLVLSLALAVALILDVREPTGGIFDVLLVIYALVLVVFSYQRGLRSN